MSSIPIAYQSCRPFDPSKFSCWSKIPDFELRVTNWSDLRFHKLCVCAKNESPTEIVLLHTKGLVRQRPASNCCEMRFTEWRRVAEVGVEWGSGEHTRAGDGKFNAMKKTSAGIVTQSKRTARPIEVRRSEVETGRGGEKMTRMSRAEASRGVAGGASSSCGQVARKEWVGCDSEVVLWTGDKTSWWWPESSKTLLRAVLATKELSRISHHASSGLGQNSLVVTTGPGGS
jgi:hypothetical protein